MRALLTVIWFLLLMVMLLVLLLMIGASQHTIDYAFYASVFLFLIYLNCKKETIFK